MPRPYRCRRIRCSPDSNYFKPRGIPIDALEEINLTLDELEAVRLADLESMYQEDAAKKMNISRQTFGNIVNSAHKKIADALLNAKALKIEGGVVEMDEKKTFKCYACDNKWDIDYGSGKPKACPKCGSDDIHRAELYRGIFRKGRGNFGFTCKRAK